MAAGKGKPNPEGLTGLVLGKKASNLEEYFYRAVVKIPDWTIYFRMRINPLTSQLTDQMKNIKGEVEMDFLLIRAKTMIPVLIQGEYSHFKAPWQAEIDADKEAVINEYFSKYPGAHPVVKIPDYKKGMYMLDSQAQADQTARSLLIE